MRQYLDFWAELDCLMVALPSLVESPELPKTREPKTEHPKSNGNQKYSQVRDREYLLESQVRAMMKAAKKGRWGHGNSTLILVAYPHGRRRYELVNLRWQ